MGNDRLYELTHPQKRVWYTEKIHPDTSLHNIGGFVEIKSTINPKFLERAINEVIRKNDALRVHITEMDGQGKQLVNEFKETKIDVIDFSFLDCPEKKYEEWIKQAAQKPFKLLHNDLFYFAILKISNNAGGYFMKMHHIISDGWSFKVIISQINDTYMKLINHEKIEDTPIVSYLDYIESEKEYLRSSRFEKNRAFWIEKFRCLPQADKGKSSTSIEGQRKNFKLDSDLTKKIDFFVSENKLSINSFFAAALICYIYKTTRKKEIAIGIPVLNRSGQKEKDMVGMFTSTMPFKFTLDETESISGIMPRIHKELMKFYFNQRYPYDLLVQDLELKKKGIDKLFGVSLNYYNTKLSGDINGIPVKNIDFYSGTQVYPLQIVIKDWLDQDSIELCFDYKIDEYSEKNITDMYGGICSIIKQVFDVKNNKVTSIDLLEESERNRILYEINSTQADYPSRKTIIDLFEEQVRATPNKIAICDENRRLTYKEFNDRVNQLAWFLKSKNLKKESIIGIMASHSVELLAAIYAVMKCGYTYLPLDPKHPKDRILQVLEHAKALILLTDSEADMDFPIERLNLKSEAIYTTNTENLNVEISPSDLVYVIYTSGSTGMPKGVMIEHGGLTNYIWWAKKMYIRDETEVFPLYSSIAFDLTVTSVFTPLISGGKIIIYRDDAYEFVLHKIVRENLCTVVKLTPAHLSLLKDIDNTKSSIKRFIVGGEDFKVSLAADIHKSFGGKIDMLNEYGPTETVVGCMIYKYDSERDTGASVPIGVPSDNVQIYILDEDLSPVPVSSVGEMYISGDGVARGYLNRSDITAERFIPNPFIEGKKMYKTGDIARFNSDYQIEYLGRADHQVKIRGYRIELGEIEKNLTDIRGIDNAVVADIEGENGNKLLCAYIETKGTISDAEIQKTLQKTLPYYMVPAVFVRLEKLPLSHNGKVERKLLPKPEFLVSGQEEFKEAKTEIQKKLMKVIEEILGAKGLGLNHNFYSIGGDSIKAIQISSRLSAEGYKLKVADILTADTIEETARYILTEVTKELDVRPAATSGEINATPIIQWFFDQNLPQPNYFNQSVLLQIKKEFDIAKIRQAFERIVKMHPALRLNYNSLTQKLFYNDSLINECIDFSFYDFSELDDRQQRINLRETAEGLKAGINIENGLLIKGALFKFNENMKLLFLTANHLAVDAVSWRIILDEFAMQINDSSFEIRPEPISYKEWADYLVRYSSGNALAELEYWRKTEKRNFELKKDYEVESGTIGNCETLNFSLDESLTEKLVYQANKAYNTETVHLLCFALAMALTKNTSDSCVIEMESHGRASIGEDFDLSRTVGWFTSMYPVEFELRNGEIGSKIVSVKEQFRRVPNYGIGYGTLKYLKREEGFEETRKIRFNFLGDIDTAFDSELIAISDFDTGQNISPKNKLTCLIDIIASITKGQLQYSITYSKKEFASNTITLLGDSIISNIKEAIEHCCEKDDLEFTASDFDTVNISQDELDSLLS